MQLCPIQEVCPQYKIDDKVRTHHRRLTVPCAHFLAFTCPKMGAVMEMQEMVDGKPVACNIDKIKRIKEGLDGKTENA